MKHSHVEDEIRERASLYALGGLSQIEAAAFEEHLAEGCETCATEFESFVYVTEQLAWADIGASPPHDVREKLLSRIALEALPSEAVEGGSSGAREKEEEEAPALPAGISTVRAAEGDWQPTADEGVFVKILFMDADKGMMTRLVRMTPGARVPKHRHMGVEQCLVLEGDLRTREMVAVSGDYIHALPGSVHDELYTEQGNLLLIIAPENYEVLQHGQQPHV